LQEQVHKKPGAELTCHSLVGDVLKMFSLYVLVLGPPDETFWSE
jgi:hypothetical protein